MKELIRSDIHLIDIVDDNFDKFLTLFRDTSDFKKLYYSMEDLWNSMAEGTRKDYKDGETIGCLIYQDGNDNPCGIIEIAGCKSEAPSVNIVIVEEDRNQGIGLTAATLFIKKIFDEYDYSRIRWEAFISNEASVKIAQKVGGVKSDENGGVGRMLEKLQELAGTEEEHLKTVLYYIERDKRG